MYSIKLATFIDILLCQSVFVFVYPSPIQSFNYVHMYIMCILCNSSFHTELIFLSVTILVCKRGNDDFPKSFLRLLVLMFLTWQAELGGPANTLQATSLQLYFLYFFLFSLSFSSMISPTVSPKLGSEAIFLIAMYG